MNAIGFVTENKWTWREKLRARLFPFTPCTLPDSPASWKDCVVSITRCELSFVDRLRVLFTGKLEVETRTVTEHIVGGTKTNGAVRAGRFWK
jgi:hypothetical protein